MNSPRPGAQAARLSPGDGSQEDPKAFTLTDFAAVIGGSIGVVYLVGYLVLSAHQRALGIGIRSTDAPVLIANAWEFGYRGALIALITLLRWATDLLTKRWVFSVVAALVVVGFLLDRRFPRLGGQTLRWLRRQPLALATLIMAISVVHLAVDTVPLTGIQDLLFSPAQSPFANLPEWLGARLTRRTAALQSSLMVQDPAGAGLTSTDPDRRASILTAHLLLTLASLATYLFLRRRNDGTRRGRFFRRSALAITIVNAVFAPIFYGVLLKSYQYPQVRITITPTADAQINKLSEDYPLKLPFLLDSTDNDLYLYFADDKQIVVVRRDTLAQFRIVGRDFVLGVN